MTRYNHTHIVIDWPDDNLMAEADAALYDAYAAYRVDAEATGARKVFVTFEAWLENRHRNFSEGGTHHG